MFKNYLVITCEINQLFAIFKYSIDIKLSVDSYIVLNAKHWQYN